MPTSISDLMSALQNLLLDHFNSINTEATTQPFLAFELGTAIPDIMFRNPANLAIYSGPLALEYLSHRSNTVPSIEQQMFVETGKTVDGLYEILLRGSTPENAAGMELLGAIKNNALSAFDEVLQVEGGISERFHPTHADPVDWYDQSVTTNWTTIHVSGADQPAQPAPHNTLAPLPARFDARLLHWTPATPEVRAQLAEPVSREFVNEMAVRKVTAVAPATLAAPIAQTARVNASAIHIAPFFAASASVAKVNPVFLSTFQRANLQQNNRVITGLGSIVLEVPPARVSPPPPPPPRPVPAPVESAGFSISVDISIVKLRRPWLSYGLLNLNSWYVPSFPKGAVSSGAGDSGMMPVLPVACVLIRNLSITAQWSDQDQKNVESSTHLGAFGLQGRVYDKNHATLTVPGMQSVAWICDPLPVLPPAAPPAPPVQ